MKKIYSLLLIVLFFCSGCSDNIQIDIDNPQNEERQITVDGEVLVLPPKTTVTLEVPRGDHNIRLENDSTFDYNFEKDNYLINPTRTDYIIEKFYFSRSGNPVLEAMFNKANRKTVVFLGYELEGNYEVFNELISARDWHYKQRQRLPQAISVPNKKFSSSKNVRKLYAADEFLQYLKDMNSEN